MRSALPILVVSLLLGGCGEKAAFTDAEKREIQRACAVEYSLSSEGAESLKRFCECSVTVALEGGDARKYRTERAKFLKQHLREATIASCS